MMIRLLLIAFIVLGILVSPAFAQVPPVGPSGCVAVDGVYDFDLNRYVPLGRAVGPCGTCWGRESGDIFQIDCNTGKPIGGGGRGLIQPSQNNLIWIVGFAIFILILVFLSPKKTPLPEAGKAAKKEPKAKAPKKESKAWGNLSIVSGILGIVALSLPFLGLIFGTLAIFLSRRQKMPTKAAIAGLILGLLGILAALFSMLQLLAAILAFILLLLLLLLTAYLLKKRKKDAGAWGIAGLVFGILSIIFAMSIHLGLLSGIAAIVFSRIQKKHKKTRIATAGLVLGIVGIIVNFIGLAVV